MREKRGAAGKRLWILAATLLAASVLLYVLVIRPSDGGRPGIQTVRVLLDGGTLGEKKSDYLRRIASSFLVSADNGHAQDCVQMGEVTRDNLEVRVMGGFIICLPHKISVEVR